MSVRGTGSFDNDDAVQWAQAYCEMGFDVAASTVAIALEDFSNNRLSKSIAARGVAAVEAIAFVLGRGSAEAQRMFKTAPTVDPSLAENLIDEAGDLLSAIAKASELSQSWADVGAAEHAAWVGGLEALRARLAGTVSTPEPAQAQPAAKPAAPAPQVAASRDEVAHAILALSRDVERLRQEMNDNFAALARRIGGPGQ